ncbi:hypothetical protein J6590_071995 [Homalodisca vitripennis]|nr:hypothetical protein J6590_071995 [Homalodisca vitripennis]
MRGLEVSGWNGTREGRCKSDPPTRQPHLDIRPFIAESYSPWDRSCVRNPFCISVFGSLFTAGRLSCLSASLNAITSHKRARHSFPARLEFLETDQFSRNTNQLSPSARPPPLVGPVPAPLRGCPRPRRIGLHFDHPTNQIFPFPLYLLDHHGMPDWP